PDEQLVPRAHGGCCAARVHGRTAVEPRADLRRAAVDDFSRHLAPPASPPDATWRHGRREARHRVSLNGAPSADLPVGRMFTTGDPLYPGSRKIWKRGDQ